MNINKEKQMNDDEKKKFVIECFSSSFNPPEIVEMWIDSLGDKWKSFSMNHTSVYPYLYEKVKSLYSQTMDFWELGLYKFHILYLQNKLNGGRMVCGNTLDIEKKKETK